MSAEITVASESCSLQVQIRQAAAPVGWQLFDPDTGLFILEGEWVKPEPDGSVALKVGLPRESGRYRIYVSPVDEAGWHYQRGRRFLVIDAEVDGRSARVIGSRSTTLGALRRQNLPRALDKVFIEPFRTLWRNRSLIRTMVRRDIMSR